ncbi:MAG: ComEC/Rec2 family competence protein [Chloroflexi bacterium]|nr:ComEC/Rec2 family competence protein [Chloroflexota bacterium]MCC6896940.1 ComEC/Rec2 family competence protein [Anaerolineae bacterium]
MRLIAIALGWAAGIVVAAGTALHAAVPWLVLAGLAVIVVGLLWRGQGYRHWTLALLAFALGGLRFTAVPQSSDVAQYNNLGGLTIEGVVATEPDVRDDRVDIRLEVQTVTRIGETVASGGLVLVQAPPRTPVEYGDRITATGLLVLPSVSDTFSYRDYLARSGVFSVMPDAAVEVVNAGEGGRWLRSLLGFKRQTADFIGRSLPEPAAGLLTGILLGDARGLSPDVSDAFSAVGASHIIAISGFNMAILSGVVMGLLKQTKVRPRAAGVIGIAVIVVYTILVGASPAVVRAAIMSSMLVIGEVLRRKSYVPTSLAFVAMLLSLLNPTVLWDVGFQLSLFATLGLALFATPLTERFNAWLVRLLPRRTARRVGDFLTEPLIVSIAAQILSLPLIILYFGQVSVVSLLVNLLVIPVQPALMVLGLAATLVAFIAFPVAQVLFWLDLLLLGWTIGVVRAFAALSFARFNIQFDPRLIALFYVVVLGGALMVATKPKWSARLANVIRSRAVMMASFSAAAGIAVLMAMLWFSRPDGLLHVWWLDAGHSNAVLIQTPGGAHILVDGGRFPSQVLTALGDRMPFNKRMLDLLVISQPDPFDYDALPPVLDRYAVSMALTNGQPNLRPEYVALLERLPSERTVAARAGYTFETADGTRLEVLAPYSIPEIGDSLNDGALVLRLTYGDVSVLLPSDASPEAQTALLASGEWPLATVMQLPNHGGVRSLNAAFLSAVQPQLVVVQSDATNRLGDPNADTLALLGETPLLRTDVSGTIHVWTNGKQLWEAGAK